MIKFDNIVAPPKFHIAIYQREMFTWFLLQQILNTILNWHTEIVLKQREIVEYGNSVGMKWI